MIIREECLVKYNSRNRIQRIHIQLDLHPFTKVYSIYKSSCQWGGKENETPVKFIKSGSYRKNTAQYANYLFNKMLQKYLNYGYVRLSLFTKKNFRELTEKEVMSFFTGNFKVTNIKLPKLMQPKNYQQCTTSVFEKDWLVTRRIEGVRVLVYYKDGMVLVSSDKGGEYNVSTKHIRENQHLLNLFQQNPDLVLDGYLYIPSVNWNKKDLAEFVKKSEYDSRFNDIEFWVYDYISDEPFKERYKVLEELKELFVNSPIIIANYKLVCGDYRVVKEHNRYVRDGFPGLWAKNPNMEYGQGKKSSVYFVEMINFYEETFKIVSIQSCMETDFYCVTLMNNNSLDLFKAFFKSKFNDHKAYHYADLIYLDSGFRQIPLDGIVLNIY